MPSAGKPMESPSTIRRGERPSPSKAAKGVQAMSPEGHLEKARMARQEFVAADMPEIATFRPASSLLWRPLRWTMCSHPRGHDYPARNLRVGARVATTSVVGKDSSALII